MGRENTWDGQLRQFIRMQWKIGESFTLFELYSECAEIFEQLHPRNRHVRDKLRQTLQHLRDEHKPVIRFIDKNGTYRRVR